VTGAALPTRNWDQPRRFAFGGVHFDVCAPNVAWSLDGEHSACLDTPQGMALAEVHCAVSGAPELARETERDIAWRWAARACRLRAGRLRAQVRELAPGRFAVSALIAPDPRGCGALAAAVAACVVDRMGGLCLHAAAVDVGGSAVLFIGPSGAGKTTAANHCFHARALARDRVLAFPRDGRWYVAALPGGEEGQLAPSRSNTLPLAAIYRVVRRSATEVGSLPAPRALAVLRESVQAPIGTDEHSLLDRIASLSEQALVGEASVVLGEALIPHLSPENELV